MTRPRPYYVSFADATPDERGPGWFWVEFTEDGSDLVHGPYTDRRDADDSIDAWQERALYDLIESDVSETTEEPKP